MFLFATIFIILCEKLFFINGADDFVNNNTNCSTYLDDLKFIPIWLIPTEPKVNITWNSNHLKECNFHYRVSIETYSSSEKISNYTEENYYIQQIEPCTVYNITVEISQKDNETVLNDLSKTWNVDIPNTDKVKDVTYNSSIDSINISWTPSKFEDICNITYIIEYNLNNTIKDIPYYRSENSTSHLIKDLKSCTKYNVSITTNDFLPPLEKPKEIIYTVTTLPEKVKDLNLDFSSDTMSVISWFPPDNHECIIGYDVSTSIFKQFTTDTKLITNGSSYCLPIIVTPISQDDHSGEQVVLLKPPPVSEIKIIPTGNSLNIKWTPTSDSCIDNYLVEINDTREYVKTREFTTNNNLTSCQIYEIKVTSKSTNGDYGEAVVEYSSTAPPEALSEVKILEALEYRTKHINLTWEPPQNAQTCNLTYSIQVNEDDESTSIYNATTTNTTLNLDLSQAIFCKPYRITLTATLNSSSSTSTTYRIIKFTEALGEVEELKWTTFDNGSSLISWKAPENSQCIIGYNVSSSLFNYSTSGTFFTTNLPLNCVPVDVFPIGEENLFGKSVRVIKPGSVRDLNVSSSDTFINISWKPPFNVDCIDGYLVQLLKNGINKTTNSTQLKVENLTPCSTYRILVKAKDKNNNYSDPETISINTTPPKELKEVQQVDIYKHDQKMLNLTWKPLENSQTCNINYLVQITDEQNRTIYNATTLNYFQNVDFKEAIFCIKYNLSVSAFVGLTKSKVSFQDLELQAVRAAPICTAQEIKSTEVVLQCNLEDRRTNECPINEFIVTCIDLMDNKSTVAKEVVSQESNLKIFVQGLEALRSYSCNAVVNGNFGASTKSNLVQFTTQEGVPDAPQLQEITTFTNTSFDVSWSRGQKMLKTFKQYNITIENLGPTYFIPENCTLKERVNVTHVTSTTTYLFSDALPSTKYKIYVQTLNEIGFGPTSNVQFITTKGGIPEEPRETNFTPTLITTDPYNVSLTLTWLYPCNTNGIVSHFKVELYGETYAGDNVTRHKLSERINVSQSDPKLNYEFVINSLRPAFNYTINIQVINMDMLQSKPEKLTFRSYESYPQSPISIEARELDNKELSIKWKEPLIKNGIIKNYLVKVDNEGPQYWIPKNCSKNVTSYSFESPSNQTTFTYKGLPNHKYAFQVRSSTGVGSSNFTNKTSILTSDGEPEQVRNLKYDLTQVRSENYNASVEVTFKYPCNTFGPLKNINITLMGTATNETYEHTFTTAMDDYSHTFLNLLPGHHYTIIVQLETEKYTSGESSYKFRSYDGVPPKIDTIQPPIPYNSTTANFILCKNLFADTNGLILYYAFILSELNYEEKSTFGFWDGRHKTWPFVAVEGHYSKGIEAYQATPEFWNPFIGNHLTNVTFMLGDFSTKFNRPLLPEVTYTFKVRGFTTNGYRDSPIVTFAVPAETKLSLILGLTFGIFGTIAMIILIFVMLRKRHNWNQNKNCSKSIQLTPIPITISKFVKIYKKLKDDEEKLKEEFKLLTEKSNEALLPTNDALLIENKKRNRYTNVLPYDETRVKLLEKNENDSNDYINASYIKGYSGNIEYIATQGPLENTVGDFWKMVIQENTSLIVMVAQFVEQNKDKCYKYFPDNHENMELENGIAVRCCTELDFKTHVVRTFMIQKDLQQWTVTHLQFTDWPDFGCPEGTEIILEFCHLMREHAERNSDPIIIHCSAGVGRTGTLIALDVLLQAINNRRDIDIFGTVLNLRKDRKNMVQTAKQYLFIYTCVDNALQNPEPIRYAMMSSNDPIYENLDDIKKENKDAHIQESKF